MSVYLDKCNRNQGQSRKAIVLRKFSQPPVRLLLEKRHVQIAAGAPFAAGDVLQRRSPSSARTRVVDAFSDGPRHAFPAFWARSAFKVLKYEPCHPSSEKRLPPLLVPGPEDSNK